MTLHSENHEESNAVGVLGNGQIVVAGRAGRTTADFIAARLNSDGSLDTRFGSNGKSLIDFGNDDQVNGLGIQSDGKVVLGGSWSFFPNEGPMVSRFAVARLTQNGQMDPTFGTDGGVTTTFFGADVGTALVIQPAQVVN